METKTNKEKFETLLKLFDKAEKDINNRGRWERIGRDTNVFNISKENQNILYHELIEDTFIEFSLDVYKRTKREDGQWFTDFEEMEVEITLIHFKNQELDLRENQYKALEQKIIDYLKFR